MTRFPEAEARLFKNMFVCRKCKTKTKTQNMRVMAGTVSCRKCGSKYLRPIKKK